MRRRTRSPAAAWCDTAPASVRTQSPRRQNCRNKTCAAPASAQSSRAVRLTPPCPRNKNPCPTCGSTHPPASESQLQRPDDNAPSRSPQCPPRNRRTRFRRHLRRQCHGRVSPPSDTNACKKAKYICRPRQEFAGHWDPESQSSASVRRSKSLWSWSPPDSSQWPLRGKLNSAL